MCRPASPPAIAPGQLPNTGVNWCLLTPQNSSVRRPDHKSAPVLLELAHCLATGYRPGVDNSYIVVVNLEGAACTVLTVLLFERQIAMKRLHVLIQENILEIIVDVSKHLVQMTSADNK